MNRNIPQENQEQKKLTARSNFFNSIPLPAHVASNIYGFLNQTDRSRLLCVNSFMYSNRHLQNLFSIQQNQRQLIRDLLTHKLVLQFNNRDVFLHAATFFPEDQSIIGIESASVGDFNKFRVIKWNASTGDVISHFDCEHISYMPTQFIILSDTIISKNKIETIKAWDMNGNVLNEFPNKSRRFLPSHNFSQPENTMGIVSNRLMCGYTNGYAALWDLATDENPDSATPHKGGIKKLQALSNNHFAVSTYIDRYNLKIGEFSTEIQNSKFESLLRIPGKFLCETKNFIVMLNDQNKHLMLVLYDKQKYQETTRFNLGRIYNYAVEFAMGLSDSVFVLLLHINHTNQLFCLDLTSEKIYPLINLNSVAIRPLPKPSRDNSPILILNTGEVLGDCAKHFVKQPTASIRTRPRI